MVTVVGILAAIAISPSYFHFFGTHKTIALVILEVMTIAAPACLLAFVWAYVTYRLTGLRRWKGAMPCLAAVILSMIYWDIQSVIFFLDEPIPPGGYKPPLLDFVMQVVFPWRQPWAIPNILAMPLGVIAAAFAFGHPPTASSDRRVASAASPA
jgi:hypothetical protein